MARAAGTRTFSIKYEVFVLIYKCLTLPDPAVAHPSWLPDATCSGTTSRKYLSSTHTHTIQETLTTIAYCNFSMQHISSTLGGCLVKPVSNPFRSDQVQNPL